MQFEGKRDVTVFGNLQNFWEIGLDIIKESATTNQSGLVDVRYIWKRPLCCPRTKLQGIVSSKKVSNPVSENAGNGYPCNHWTQIPERANA